MVIQTILAGVDGAPVYFACGYKQIHKVCALSIISGDDPGG
jgi:hypothetical protein